MSRITLSKPGATPLEVKPAPFQAAVRWRSQHERRHSLIWPNIFMTQDVFHEVNQHAASEPDLEVGGMLIGSAFFTPEKQMIVLIDAQVEARYVHQGSAHLTFTSRTLTDVLDRLEADHADKQIVGWYHTHPGLSVFMSSMDVWLHSHFFPKPWHVALVIDPYVHHGGFFYYPGNVSDYYIHPRHFVGFYELVGQDGNSTMTWQNLTRDGAQRSRRSSDEVMSARKDY